MNVVARRAFAPHFGDAGEVRRFVADHVPSPVAEDAALVVSELVSNAILHAATAFDVAVAATNGCVHVEVADGSAAMPVRRAIDPDTVGGRGLRIVEQLSDRWGVRPTPAGKVVWFEIDERT